MIAHIHNEISGDWTQLVIKDLNPEVGMTIFHEKADAEIEELYRDIEDALHSGGGTSWNLVGWNRTPHILTIHSRSERGHDRIMVINVGFSKKS